MASALALLAIGGCGGATPAPSASAPSAPALPPRPVTLSLDRLDPCSLLTAQQQKELSVEASGTSNEDFGGPLKGGPICLWTKTAEKPDNEYTGSAVLNHGAEYALGSEPLRSVDGFAATTTTSLGSDPNRYCGLLVDVAPGKALYATYDNPRKDAPGMNRQTACSNAQELAEAMLTTLRAQQGR